MSESLLQRLSSPRSAVACPRCWCKRDIVSQLPHSFCLSIQSHFVCDWESQSNTKSATNLAALETRILGNADYSVDSQSAPPSIRVSRSKSVHLFWYLTHINVCQLFFGRESFLIWPRHDAHDFYKIKNFLRHAGAVSRTRCADERNLLSNAPQTLFKQLPD